MQRPAPRPRTVSISIIAGGLSSRMGLEKGREKARLRLGRRSLLGHVRAAAAGLGWPVRILRKDAVPRCGPLGGIYTALLNSRADAELFLACDMPFVSPALLRSLPGELTEGTDAASVMLGATAGFPLVLRTSALPVVAEQVRLGRFSLQSLLRMLNTKQITLPRELEWELTNVNTPEDWSQARKLHAQLQRSPRRTRSLKPATPGSHIKTAGENPGRRHL